MLEELGIQRQTIPLPFRLNHVNCFIAEGEKGYILIDTGLNNRQTEKIWDELLDKKQIDKILITHMHPDHYGFAGQLQKRTGAHLSMSKIDADTANFIWKENALPLLLEDYDKASVPEKIDRKSTRLNSSHVAISYAVFCLKKKT